MKSYSQFLQQRTMLRKKYIDGVKHQHLELLDRVFEAEHGSGEPLTVGGIMHLAEIASSATLHRWMDELILVGAVELRFVPGNRRTKFIHLTKDAADYYSELVSAIRAIK